MNQPPGRSRSELIQQMTGFPILGIRPKGIRQTLSESAKRALAREIGLAICGDCGQSVVVGDNPGAGLILGRCATCAHLIERADDLPPPAAA